MTRLTKSQPVALLGEAPPRVLVVPHGVRANSWADVSDLSARSGVVLDGWQELILESAMGERSDATWAAKRVGITVPRQNGKSQLLVARALAGVLLFGERKIVISAHQQDTAREAFNKLVEILEADGNGWLMDRVRPNGVMNAINREQVKFKNGATIQFKARSGAAGKGFSSDCLLLDEAQILSQRAWVSINSTMSAMPNPQVWLLGTSPQEEDDSEVFESIRSAAIEGRSSAAAWCEWGADINDPDYDPASEYTRWSANPAWNTRINHEVVDGEFETYPVDKFAQDRLGVWRSEMGDGSRAISAAEWKATGVDVAPTEGVRSFAVAFSFDGSRLALAGALRHAGGVHVELIDAADGDIASGLAALADWPTARWKSVAVIALSGSAGAPVLAQLLKDRRVPDVLVKIVNTAEYTQSCSMTLDAIRESSARAKRNAEADASEPLRFTHLASDGQAQLDSSIAVSDRKQRGTSGAWGWMATTPDGDETPTEAVSLAYWAAKTTKRKPRGDRERKAVIL